MATVDIDGSKAHLQLNTLTHQELCVCCSTVQGLRL